MAYVTRASNGDINNSDIIEEIRQLRYLLDVFTDLEKCMETDGHYKFSISSVQEVA